MVTVKKVENQEELEAVFSIRETVFVIEQNVDRDDEYDEFEETSEHFIATLDGIPVGTSRWRTTNNGIKLERFAVLKEARGKQVGSALVQATLDDIEKSGKEDKKYLHAQLDAVPLYSKFGFQKIGDVFVECEIEHYLMEL